MEPIWKGKQANKTSNMCASDKGKQTNKQVEAAHAEVQMQGAVQSYIPCRVQCAICQSMQRSFGDASEMHQKSAEFDMQGCTLTLTHQTFLVVLGSADMRILIYYQLQMLHLQSYETTQSLAMHGM